jgi:uncharacterized protein
MAVSVSVRRRSGLAASLALSTLLLSSCASVMRSVRGPTAAVETRATSVTTLNLNVRKGPGMGHRVLTSLPKGTAVEILGTERSWRKVRAERKGKPILGWVAAKYLKPGAASDETAKAKSDQAKAERERQQAEREQESATAKAEREAERQRARAAAEAARDRREAERQREQTIAKADREDAGRRNERKGSLARWHAPDRSKPAPPPEPDTEAAMVAALPATRPTPVLAPPPSIVDSVGYAAETRPLRESLARGKFNELDSHFERVGSGPTDREAPTAAGAVRLFPLLERGAVEVDRGRVEQAAQTFASAEALLASREVARPERGFGLGRLFSSRAAGSPTNGAFGEPFERVWMLDYHALALLLAGDPEAIAVAERAIASQQLEREQLERAIEAADREVADARERVGDEAAKAVAGRLAREYARSADRAKKTASPFDNPFAHYVAAIAEELGGRRDPKLREKARAHYEEALRLNPKSELFGQAVDDLSTDEEATDDRVVHVLVAEGFAPEKRALRYPLAADGSSIEVRLPIYSPVPSTFATAALAIDPSEPPVILSEIVDVEAASFRYEQDTRVRRELAVLRAVRAGDDMPEPDTSSWMTLPARFHAARLRLPKGEMKLALATFDEQHQRVGGTTVVLDPEADALIYVRSAGSIVAIRATSPEWFARDSTATASADGLVP